MTEVEEIEMKARTREVLTQIKCLGFTFYVHWVN